MSSSTGINPFPQASGLLTFRKNISFRTGRPNSRAFDPTRRGIRQRQIVLGARRTHPGANGAGSSWEHVTPWIAKSLVESDRRRRNQLAAGGGSV